MSPAASRAAASALITQPTNGSGWPSPTVALRKPTLAPATEMITIGGRTTSAQSLRDPTAREGRFDLEKRVEVPLLLFGGGRADFGKGRLDALPAELVLLHEEVDQLLVVGRPPHNPAHLHRGRVQEERADLGGVGWDLDALGRAGFLEAGGLLDALH